VGAFSWPTDGTPPLGWGRMRFFSLTRALPRRSR
jgi:hypothetical protein